MLNYLDKKERETGSIEGVLVTPSRKAKTSAKALVSPTLQRYASASRKRDLSQYLADEKKAAGKTGNGGAAAGNGGVTARGMPTTSVAAAKPVGGMTVAALADQQQKAASNKAATPIPEKDPKKPYFRAFEHPFMIIDDADLLHMSVWKEYTPELAKQQSNKSNTQYPTFFWDCPVGYCPFICYNFLNQQQQQQQQQQHPSPKDNPVKVECGETGIQTRSRATKQQSKIPVSTKAAPKMNTAQMAEVKTVSPPKQAAAFRPKRPSLMNANRSRPGYCECCYERYSELDKHVKSLIHRQFALEPANYTQLDSLLRCIKRPAAKTVDVESQMTTAPLSRPVDAILRPPVSQKSLACDDSATCSTSRNYTASKRAKQTQALLEFKPGEQLVESGAPGDITELPSSPSCKRRRSSHPNLQTPRTAILPRLAL